MNIVALIGNVATEPELRHTPSGRAICTFRLAVSRPGAESADFFTVVCWERQAEVAAEYLTVARRVSVEGRLHHTSNSGPDGEPQSRVEIVAHRLHLLGGRAAQIVPIDCQHLPGSRRRAGRHQGEGVLTGTQRESPSP